MDEARFLREYGEKTFKYMGIMYTFSSGPKNTLVLFALMAYS